MATGDGDGEGAMQEVEDGGMGMVDGGWAMAGMGGRRCGTAAGAKGMVLFEVGEAVVERAAIRSRQSQRAAGRWHFKNTWSRCQPAGALAAL
jgi:hypothetical protein